MNFLSVQLSPLFCHLKIKSNYLSSFNKADRRDKPLDIYQLGLTLTGYG